MVKIALLIDCENISFKDIEFVLNDLAVRGSVNVRRAYGNWNSGRLNGWMEPLKDLAIRPIHQLNYSKGKNSTDIAIVIDALDLSYAKHVDAFAFFSSDSDFTPLILRLREQGFDTFGYGYDNCAKSLKNSYTEFKLVPQNVSAEVVSENTPKEKIVSPAPDFAFSRDADVIKYYTQLFASLKKEDVGMLDLMALVEESSAFHPSKFGIMNHRLFLTKLNIFNISTKNILKLKQNVIDLLSPPLVFSKSNKLGKGMIKLIKELNGKDNFIDLGQYSQHFREEFGVVHFAYGFSNFKDFLEKTALFQFKESQIRMKA